MTSPVSRSATNQASAEMSPGTGGVPGAVTRPQLPRASPPTGLAGTGSGAGAGSPGLGTSEASTAGGVFTLYGQASGSATATAGAAPRSKAVARAVPRSKAPRLVVRDLAMVGAD